MFFLKSPISREKRAKNGQGATTSGNTTVVFSNSGTARADSFALPEDVVGPVYLNVMANDGGGTNTILWSLDDGTSSLIYASSNNGGSGVSAPLDLITQDTARC